MVRNVHSAFMMKRVLDQISVFVPHTNSALDHRAIQIICNDILINGRKTVVELGAGYSTILIARFIEMNKLECKMLSFEENNDWHYMVNKILGDEKLTNYAKVYHAHVDNGWYTDQVLNQGLNESDVDLLIVDGPNAKTNKDIRAQAKNYFESKMADKSMILIDDVDRKAEYRLLKDWQSLGKRRMVVDNTSGYLLSGEYYNIF